MFMPLLVITSYDRRAGVMPAFCDGESGVLCANAAKDSSLNTAAPVLNLFLSVSAMQSPAFARSTSGSFTFGATFVDDPLGGVVLWNVYMSGIGFVMVDFENLPAPSSTPRSL